jgi:hypothetical protein
MKTSIFFPICIFIAVGCSQPNQKLSFETPLLQKYFTETERPLLAKMVQFTDSLVMANTKETQAEVAYHVYLDTIQSLMKNGDWMNYSFNEPEKQEFLFNLDTTFFNKIWEKSIPRIVKSKDTTLYSPENYFSLSLNYKGEYVKYLKEKGMENEFYKSVHESIENAGDISPVVFGTFLLKHRELNFGDSENRLWASVFILRMSDPMELKVKRYLAR